MKVLSTVISIFSKKKSASTKPPLETPSAVWRNPFYFLAFGLGSGAMPFAPGTFGTLMAVPFYLIFFRLLPLPAYLIFVLVFIAISIYLCDIVSRDMHIHDHPGIVIDEFAGFFVTMINAPIGIFWVVLGFLLFRLFDVWKPWPIRFLDEKIPGGVGIVIDDVLAGIYALIIMQLLKLI